MKIAITGSSGFIGKNCVDILRDSFEIIAISRNRKNNEKEYEGVKYFETDYSVESLLPILDGCEGIVHLAAQKVANGEKDKLQGYIPSIRILENVINAAHESGIRNIVNCSSRCVYGEYTHDKFAEDDRVFPINFYGVSKLMCEQLCEYYNNKYGMKIKNFRLSQVISGPSRGNERNMFSTFLHKAMGNEDIEIWGDGMDIRDYICIEDVCESIKKAMECPETGGIYNIGSGVGISNKEMADIIVKQLNSKSVISCLRDKEVKNCRIILDTRKAEEQLGFKSKYSINQYLKYISAK